MKKFYLDILLFIVFLLVMSFPFLPHILHEVLGIILFFAMSGHFTWNIKTFKNHKYNFLQIIDIFLLISLVIITVAGILISNFLFVDMFSTEYRKMIIIHQLHVTISYVMFILIGVHLGINWRSIQQRSKKIINIELPSYVEKIFVGIMILIGIYGSFANQIGDRLMMEHIFATKATDLPFGIFLLMMICIFSIYVLIGYWISSKISR